MICRLSNDLTGSAMKVLEFSKAAIMMAALFFISSCIFEAPHDQFYRTRWTTSEAPLAGLIIEFECEGYISASSDYDSCKLLGKYSPCGNKAYFTDLYVCSDSCTFIIEEAHLSDKSLIITWHISEISSDYIGRHMDSYSTGTPHTTGFHLM